MRRGMMAVLGAGLALQGVAGTCCKVPPALFKPGSTVLFQGDSITDGAHGGDMNHFMGHGYQAEIAMRFLAYRVQDGIRFANRARSGDQSTKILARWDRDGVNFSVGEICYGRTVGLPEPPRGKTIPMKADYISLLTGINEAGLDVAVYEQNLRELVRRARAANPDIRFILCEPFRGRTMTQENLFAKQIVVADLAHELGAPFVPFQKMFNERCRKANPNCYYWIWDEIHPTYAGHMFMADFWIETVAAHQAHPETNPCLIPLGRRTPDWVKRHMQIAGLDPWKTVIYFGDGTASEGVKKNKIRGSVLDAGIAGDRIENMLFRLDHGELCCATQATHVVISAGAENRRPRANGKTDTEEEIAAGLARLKARIAEKVPQAKIICTFEKD